MKSTLINLENGYLLNGSKMWITNGSINGKLGDDYLIYAKHEGGLSMVV